jgi:hypothetical protein
MRGPRPVDPRPDSRTGRKSRPDQPLYSTIENNIEGNIREEGREGKSEGGKERGSVIEVGCSMGSITVCKASDSLIE